MESLCLSFSVSLSKSNITFNRKQFAPSIARRPISAVHAESKVSSQGLTLPKDVSFQAPPTVDSRLPSFMEDVGTYREPNQDQVRSMRSTKLVCTIGPATCGSSELEALAAGGLNVARINMCHGTHEWHRRVIQGIRKLNEEKGYCIAIMMDTQGSEIHMGDLGGASSVKAEDGDIWIFSVRSFNSRLPQQTVSVNYDGFAEDVQVGDEIVVDGGMARFEVAEKIGPDVKCWCIDPGLLLPRANLTIWRDGKLVQDRIAMLPTISSKDWLDIDFGITEGVDFIAISFVKSAEVITHLKSYIAAQAPNSGTAVIAKIESIDSLNNLEDIIQASDGVMVARGDLGAQIPLEEVPSAQKEIVELCRQLNKPVIVASQLLESMVEYPIPTRAEAADVSEAVRQQADGLMLSGESAMGQYPHKALSVLDTISLRIEKFLRQGTEYKPMDDHDSSLLTGSIQEVLCNAASEMANKLDADAILVHTSTGDMASFVSRCRPNCPIYAFTPSISMQRRLNMRWGIIPFRVDLTNNSENNIKGSIALLKAEKKIKSGDVVISLTDSSQSIQVVNVP